MKQVLGVTFNEKEGQQTVGVYIDENGAECFVTDEPYLLSDGTSLTEPLPIRIVDGPYDTNAPLMMIKTPSEGGGGPVETRVFYDTFQRADTVNTLGNTESGWVWFNSGNFRVLNNAACLVTFGTGARRFAKTHNLLADFEYTLKVETPASGNFDIGHLLRAGEHDSLDPFLYTKFCHSQNNVQLIFNNGSDATLASATRSYTLGQTYEFAVKMVGKQIDIYINEVLVLSHALSNEIDAALTGRHIGITAHQARESGSRIVSAQTERVGPKVPLFEEIISHRGLVNGPYSTSNDPENSLICLTTLPSGISIETDHRQTNDSDFILLHDTTMDRTTDGTGTVNALTTAYVTGRTIKGLNGGLVPTSAQFLAAAAAQAGRTHWLDYEGGNDTSSMNKFITQARNAGLISRSIFFFGSISAVQMARGLAPDIRIALGSVSAASVASDAPLAAAAGVEVCLLAPGDGAYAANAGAIPIILANGMEAGISSISTSSVMLAAAGAGATVCLTDYPRAVAA